MQGDISKKPTRAQDPSVVLVVDEDESYLKIIRDALGEAGCRVTCCAAPPKAREVALEVEPDIFLVDLVMPEMDGVELCRRFRAEPRFNTAVIVLMTSEEVPTKNPDALIRGLEAGADDYLIKPFGIQEVPIRLRAWWRAKRLRDELIADAQQTLQDMARSEERFRSMVESTSDWFWEVDRNGVYTYASPRVKDLLGYEPEEVLGKTPFEFMPPREAERIVRFFQGKMAAREPLTALENVNLHKDGRRVVLETSGVPVLDAGGELVGYRGTDRDITEHKRIDEEILELARLPGENPNPVLRIGSEGTVLYANASSQRLLTQWLGPAGVEPPASIKEMVDEVLRTRVCKQVDMDVGGRAFLFVMAPVPEEVYVNVYGLDVTERKQTVVALRHEQAYITAILSSMADALFVVSGEGAIVTCNQRALDMLGYERDELIGCSLGKVFAPSPELPGTGLRGVGKRLLHAKIRNVDAFLRCRDGRVAPVSLSCSLLTMPDGETSELVLVARDISGRHRLQEEQRNYAQRLEREVDERTEDIRRSAEEYRILFKNVDHAIITTDLDNKLLTCNAAAERLFGWKEAEILGRTAGEALCGKPYHAKYADIQASVAALGFWAHEGTGRRADGQDFPMHLSVSVIRQESGLPQGMIWIVTDLSDRYGLEEATQRAQDYAEIVLAKFGPHGMLVGSGKAHKRIARFVSDAAGVLSPVLVLGESGTGKDVVARAIHLNSPCAGGAFVVVDCASLHGSLLETELFGHEKGAFTGAVGAKRGLVELATGGTLFVDEIGDMPLKLQSKLLRILDCGEFRRVGSLKVRKVNMRIIAATNHDLASEVKKGEFRNDLYFRLNVLSITMPPLRERREDIPLLAKHFAKHSRITTPGKKRFRADALRCLQAYDWPGNIRELANVVERALILAGPQTVLQPSHLPPDVRAATGYPERGQQARSLAQAEKETIEAALAATKGNRSKAAKMLGTSRMTLRKMMKKHGVSVLKH